MGGESGSHVGIDRQSIPSRGNSQDKGFKEGAYFSNSEET